MPDNVNLKQELVKAGHAWHHIRFAPDDKELAELERAAREERIGLWSEPDPIAPWDFQQEPKQ